MIKKIKERIKERKPDESGATLLEVVIVIALLAITSSITIPLFTMQFNQMALQTEFYAAQSSINSVENRFMKAETCSELREVRDNAVSLKPESHTIEIDFVDELCEAGDFIRINIEARDTDNPSRVITKRLIEASV